MSEHECPYDNDGCEIGSMCPQCTRDRDVYVEYGY